MHAPVNLENHMPTAPKPTPMPTPTPPAGRQDRFKDLLRASADERSAIRAGVAEGRWRDCEPNQQRAAAFAARATPGLRNFAEVQIGGTLDYQSASFLARGADVRRAVGMVEVNLGGESRSGTGFLIGAGLFITNAHVIKTAEEALSVTVTFDRELDVARIPLASTSFRLDPQRFFAASPEDRLDFAVVALGPRLAGPAETASLGHCALSPEPNKHVLGMNVNIIQHPRGNYKQVAIRNNLLTFRTDRALLYETDTEVGSSGAPVFNDLWDVVALHHFGQPSLARLDVPGAPDVPVNANEGIRISAIHAALAALLAGLPPAQRALLGQALDLWKKPFSGGDAGAPDDPTRPRGQLAPRAGNATTAATSASQPESASAHVTPGAPPMSHITDNSVTVTVPLEITIRLGASQPVSLQPRADADVASVLPRLGPLAPGAEAAKVDRDYSSRTGYQADFLPRATISLPQPDAALKKQIAPLRASEPDAMGGLLKYEHFSLKMHQTRRVAIYTATNIDGDTYLNVDRATGQVSSAQEADTWFKDPRISESFYLGQDFYGSTSRTFDRGHLTRRSDPTWGTPQEAERANADTFHFTNASPQHFRFNQSARFWQGVERYILETGINQAGLAARLCVFQGPLYDDSIDWWVDNEIQIPSSYWKIVVWRGAKKLKSVGLVVDQLPLLTEERRSLGQPQDTPFFDVSTWRVPVADIGTRTGLKFDADVVAADTIGLKAQPQPGAEAARRVLIRSLQEIML
jgi:endonuclease G, mitochondrial